MKVKIEASKLLYKKITELIFFIRRSPKDLVATFFAVFFLIAGQWLFDENKHFTLPVLFKQQQAIFDLYKPIAGILFILLAIGLIIWIIYRLWKVALPPIYIDSKTKLSHAIKGLLAFNAEDGELFSKLERHRELNELYQYIVNPQQSIIVLMGESGAGKTSLLRAGLSHILEPKQITYIYWEAFPEQAEISLLQTINASLNSQYQQLNELVNHSEATVIVLDQFEQLSIEKHPEIFQLLTAIIKSPPPHQLSWVIAFRREYDPEWRDYELSLGDYRLLPMLSLKLFSKAQAQNIFTILASEAGLSLDQALVDGFMSSMQHQERISPVDISIGLVMLNELASQQQKSYLSLEDYQFAGGSEGLFVNFINSKFERFAENEKQSLLKVLLALIDKNGYKRIAEGKSLAQLLKVAQLPEKQLNYMLDYLASNHVRLLEKLPDGFYRLPHETIIPALRRLTSLVLAEAEQAELKLKTAYEAWQKSNEKNTGYLLKGKELGQVLTYLPQLNWQTQDKALFIKKSIKKRTRLRVSTVIAVLLLSLTGFYGWQSYQISIYKNALYNWGIPADLYDYQTQLEKLTIMDQEVRHLDWLKRLPGLKELELIGVSINDFNKSLQNLPNLTTLKILSTATVTSIQGLGSLSALTHLNLRHNNLSTLDNLQDMEKLAALTTLNLQDNFELNSLQGIEKLPSLNSLYLRNNDNLSSLQDLNKLTGLTTLHLRSKLLNNLQVINKLTGLTTLDLNSNFMSNLQGLEKLVELTSLNLSGNKLTNLQGLEKLTELTTLNLSNNNLNNLHGLENLTTLKTLSLTGNNNLSSLQGIEKLTALTTLKLSGKIKLDNLQGLEKLSSLTTLILSYNYNLSNLHDLEKLTSLTTLDLGSKNLKSLQGLEKLTSLTTLNLRGNVLNLRGNVYLKNLQAIENLTTLVNLDLNGNKLKGLQYLEKLTSLTTLDLSHNKLNSLQGLEKLTSLTTLNLSRNNLTNLQGLEKLTALTTLNLSGNRNLNIQGLENLTALITLNLNGTNLTHLQSLKNLKALTELDLGHNNLKDLHDLKNLTALTKLSLKSNYGLKDLQGLENLPALTSLDLFYTSLSSLQGLPVSVTKLMLGDGN